MGHPSVEAFKNRIPDREYVHEAHGLFPLAEQEAPVDAKELNYSFRADWEAAHAAWKGKRITATGVVTYVGPDIHNAPSFELSDSVDGDCYVIVCFAKEEDYCGVQVGDTVVVQGNYLTTHENYGVCLKMSNVVK